MQAGETDKDDDWAVDSVYEAVEHPGEVVRCCALPLSRGGDVESAAQFVKEVRCQGRIMYDQRQES